jgi:hypothetical protein
VSDHRAESLTVNAAGLVQGIALVTFPAASGIFTSRTGYDLTSSQYGLVCAGVRAPEIFAASAVVAGLMGLFSFVVARGRPSPATLHPRPTPVRIRREALLPG